MRLPSSSQRRPSQYRRDLLRVVSVPAPWLLLGLQIMFAVGTTVSMALLDGSPSPSLALGSLPAIAGLLGAVTVGADFRFGSTAAEILALGGPLRYLLRGFRAVATVAAVIGVAAAAAHAVAWMCLFDQPLSWSRCALLLCAAVTTGVGWSVLGAALAVAVRGQIGSVATVLAYLMIVEPLLEVTLADNAGLLPGRAAVDLFSAATPATFAAPAGRLLAVAAVVILGVCAVSRHGDVMVTAT